ncbi:MAG: hypothetical protein MJK10_13920 [Pseudomonadales bacterium]|nr:hypothetical protein [Pseudomonadales bacterium]NRA17248.1 hypothetical protein [Oceanospirillaceae bacterium]
MKNDTDSQKLKLQLRAHYLQQQLSSRQLQQLQGLTANSNRHFFSAITAVAASTIFALGLYLFNFSTPDYSNISREIAYNHNSKMQMEVLSPALNDVKGHLNRLGFNLVSSSKLDSEKLHLIGGRYCNINGKIAAQMKLQHSETKKVYTFYQAKMPADIVDSFEEVEVLIDGVKVKLWREKGLLMGLAF